MNGIHRVVDPDMAPPWENTGKPLGVTFGASGRILLLSNETRLGGPRPGNRAGFFIGRRPTMGCPTNISWDAEYNLCVVQLVTSVQLVTCNL
jgi:hypothetical protein